MSLSKFIPGISLLRGTLANTSLKYKLQQRFVSSAGQRKVFKIGVQGAGFDRGQRKPGVDDGPNILRREGFVEFLRDEAGHDVKDYDDIAFGLEKRISLDASNPDSLALRNVAEVARGNKLISEKTAQIIQDGRIPLTIGGDHSIAIGTISGVTSVHPDIGVLWVDAHADINVPQTTTTGNMHGMPVGFLLKQLQEHASKVPEFSWLKQRLCASKIAYIGLRSVDPGERATLDRLGISFFSMKEVDRLGIIEVTHRALEKIAPNGNRPIHISFDIDALDDLELGGATGTPVPGGLSLREGMTLLEEVHVNSKIASVDLVEVNPAIGYNDLAIKRVASLSKHLVGSLFGMDRGGGHVQC